MRRKVLVKRMLLLSVFVFFSIFLTLYSKSKKSQTVNATPITNKRIVVDAGHGLPDEGAEGFFGTTEQAINLSIALKLQKLIEQSGAEVILTRSDENGIYSTDAESIRSKKVSDIKNRVELANTTDSDIFVSIHLNKYQASTEYRGWQTFYQKDSEESKKIAENIQEYINKNIEYDNTRSVLPISDVYIMEHVKIPSVIVECGFLSNEEETSLLITDEYQNKLAWGIFIALENYFYEKGT